MADYTHTGRADLRRLDDMDNYEVADGYPDIRGWDVKMADDRTAGTVDSLIVDPGTLDVRYMDVALDEDTFDLDDERHVLIPLGRARLDDDNDQVLLTGIGAPELKTAPAYEHGDLTGADHEQHRSFYGRTGHDRDLYDERGFWGKRGRPDRRALVLSEEELNVGKRKVEAGEVDVAKHQTTEHVRKEVPVSREQVTVERRPVGPNTPRQATGGPNEIHVPVMEEEVVTEKRMVPKEEVVIRKTAERDTKTVEADLKKDKVDVSRKGNVRRTESDQREQRPNL